MLRAAEQRRIPVRTSAAVVAQVWRDGSRQVNLARTLDGVATLPLDPRAGRGIGELVGNADSRDVVDGHIALLSRTGDTVLTSDDADIQLLLDTARVRAAVVHV